MKLNQKGVVEDVIFLPLIIITLFLIINTYLRLDAHQQSQIESFEQEWNEKK